MLGGPLAVTLDQADALRWPIITEADEQAVLAVLRSGSALAIHPVVAELEQDYRTRLGVTHAVAHNNGTGGLHAAMHAVGVGPGDEVIVPSATWWASVMPILHQGGIPVFAETESDRGGLDPADVAAKVTDRTKAIVVVHLFGMPSKTDELLAIARQHGLKVIEDASHAHGATDQGRPIGTLGDLAVFSMQGNKLVPSAEGGMLVTNDDALHEKVIRFGHYERLLPMKDSPNRRFAATGFGHKFRMSPLSAAVARTQLARLDEHNARRAESCIALSRRLEALGCFNAFLAPADVTRTYFEFLVSYDPDAGGAPLSAVAKALQAEGAQVAAPRYPLLHQQPMFTEGTWASIARLAPTAERPLPAYDPRALPRTIAGNARLLRLPAFPNGTPQLVEQYAVAFEKVLARAADLPREDDA